MPASAPLNRVSRKAFDLDVSTLADWAGAAAAALMPLVEAIRAHIFAAERMHADDTTVPVPTRGKNPGRPIMDLYAR
jgi:transposase